MTATRTVHRALGDPRRERILTLLRERGELGVAELGAELGLHRNTVRAHVRVLADAGLVAVGARPSGRRGRPRAVFRATGAEDEAAGTRLLAEALVREVDAAGAGRAGEALGRALAGRAGGDGLEGVVALLDEAGFAARLEGDTLLMERCPFSEVGSEHRTVVCAVHLGLLQGALEELGAPAEADELTPFARPGVCTAHLAPVSE